MEEVQGELEVFAGILLQQYIRMFTAATYIRSEKAIKTAKFKIEPEVYAQLRAEPLQTSLLGLDLDYDAATQVLTATPDAEFLEEFTNNIMRDVALQYADTYKNRYAKFILFIDNA